MISIGQLCDDNGQVMLYKKNLYAFKNEILILQNNRSRSGDGLWDIPINSKHKIAPLKAPKEA